MGERRYRISFEIADEELDEIKSLTGAYEGEPTIRMLVKSVTWWRINYPTVEIIQDEAPKQSEGAGCSCGQTDDGQVFNQLGDASIQEGSFEELDLYKDWIKEVGAANLRHAKKLAQFRHSKCHTLPKPCPICNKCNVDTPEFHAKHANQADEKEHPEDFCMFCGGELAHCDNSLWDGVWVHSVCIPY